MKSKKFFLKYGEISIKEDILSWYRKRIIYLFSAICWVFVLPIAISNIIDGEIPLALSTIGLLLVLALNTLSFYYKKFQSAAVTIFVITLMTVITFSLTRRGIYGLFWAYPSVLFIFFIVQRRVAEFFTGIFFLYFCSLSFYLLEFGTAIRSVIALVMTILFTDIFLSIIEHLQERLQKFSNTDALTKALNRRQLRAELISAFERKHRTNTPACILLFDIDHFKSINDEYGHPVGDEVLKGFASLLNNRARKLDKLFRIGGEEFLLLLPDTPIKGAKPLAEEIRQKVSETDFIKDRQVTVSIGIAELGEDESVENWLKRSDSALYDAKNIGRNQFVVCITELEFSAKSHKSIQKISELNLQN